MAAVSANDAALATSWDLVVVGAGLSGLAMIHRARQLGWRVRCFEAGGGVGGTWYWNRYPGCRVDIESFEYAYSFCEQLQQDWSWSERYAPQPEVERYCNHVADRFGLRAHIAFDTRVLSAHWQDASCIWELRTDQGECVRTRLVALATGAYSAPYRPDFEGLDHFRGLQLQSSRWPREPVDFTGKRVGIIGTGASGVQLAPIIARLAAQLTVFQRTAAYTVPLQNHALSEQDVRERKARYAALREAQWCSSGRLHHRALAAGAAADALGAGGRQRRTPPRVRGALGLGRPELLPRIHRPAHQRGG